MGLADVTKELDPEDCSAGRVQHFITPVLDYSCLRNDLANIFRAASRTALRSLGDGGFLRSCLLIRLPLRRIWQLSGPEESELSRVHRA